MPSTSGLRPIRKKLVTNEQHQPIAVQIDYEDWLEIEHRLGLGSETDQAPPHDFDRLLAETSGIWSEGDGLEYQRRLREEWTRSWDLEAREGT